MIVISGALVLVALVLLVIGVVDPSLPFVYASIAVSLVSLVFLVIGILQRRGEPLPAGQDAPAATQVDDDADAPTPVRVTKDSSTRTIPVQAAAPVEQEELEDAELEELETGGTVLVVAGRPRYHVEGCRYLTGKDAEALDVLDAREEGFTACGVCKPDEALAAVPDEPAVGLVPAAEPLAEQEYDEEPLEDEVVEDEPAEEVVPVPLPRRRAAATKATSVRAGRTAAVAEVPAPVEEAPPVVERPARKAPAKKATRAVADPLEEVAAGRGAKASASSPTKAARTPARKAATAPAPAKATRGTAKAEAAAAAEGPPAAPTTARRTGTVVVIPERGRFHKADCRYVRGADGAEVLTKAQATKQGFEACGVCKP